MAKLSVLDGPDIGLEYELAGADKSEQFTVGRDPEVAVALNDPSVSREHFRIERAGKGWRIVDLGSRNRTLLNGSVVRESALRNGDLLRLGDTELRFQDDSEVPSTSTAEDVGSTIIKELPGVGERETFLHRIDNLERLLHEEKSRRALGEVRRLFEVYSTLTSATSSTELFQRLLSELYPLLEADSAAVLVCHGDDWKLAASEPPDEAVRSRISRSVVDRVVATGKALLVENLQQDVTFREKDSIAGSDLHTVVVSPMMVDGKIVALLYAERGSHKGAFRDDQLEVLHQALEPAGPILGRLQEETRLREENRNFFRTIVEDKRIVGRSAAKKKIDSFIERAAPAPQTVLITGETGTGKELVASAIHFLSPRRGGPFVAVNCAALPENLVESELFGHERGAFTGAVGRRKGRFELADTGTIFLDEVGELSLACQAKLLRLLEERSFERVGGGDPIKVNVRVVAATNRVLWTCVEEKTFREDLFYRLSVLNLELPPLRERQEDIPLLAAHFLKQASRSGKSLSKDAEKRLLEYEWPGNVRQLRNVIESAVVMGDSEVIQASELAFPARAGRKSSGGAKTKSTAGPATEEWAPVSLSELEKKHIQRVLEHTGGNKKKAAEILGIERCTLYAKIKNYQL